MFKASAILNKLRSINWLYKIFLRLISFFSPRNFNDIECFCLFIGYPYSGHTIVGALLDAHPEIVISIEADVLGLIEKGYSRRLVYEYILRNSSKFTTKRNATWHGNSYKVPGLYQGSYKKIRIIGDKKGAKTTNRLICSFNLLLKLEKLTGKPLKMIHVVRNPLDNIASILRANEKKRTCSEDFFRGRVDYFFRNADINAAIIEKYRENVITIYHEDFIRNPSETLEKLLAFLSVEPVEGYIEKCSSIVKKSPNLTRDLVSWPEGLKETTVERMKSYPFFEGYLSHILP